MSKTFWPFKYSQPTHCHVAHVGVWGKEPPWHRSLPVEQVDQQQGRHRPLRLGLPRHHKGQDWTLWWRWQLCQLLHRFNAIDPLLDQRLYFFSLQIKNFSSGVHDLNKGQQPEPKVGWEVPCHRLPSGSKTHLRLTIMIFQTVKTFSEMFCEMFSINSSLFRPPNWDWMWQTRIMRGVRCYL